jgi:hypothetical protein
MIDLSQEPDNEQDPKKRKKAARAVRRAQPSALRAYIRQKPGRAFLNLAGPALFCAIGPLTSVSLLLSTLIQYAQRVDRDASPSLKLMLFSCLLSSLIGTLSALNVHLHAPRGIPNYKEAIAQNEKSILRQVAHGVEKPQAGTIYADPPFFVGWHYLVAGMKAEARRVEGCPTCLTIRQTTDTPYRADVSKNVLLADTPVRPHGFEEAPVIDQAKFN